MHTNLSFLSAYKKCRSEILLRSYFLHFEFCVGADGQVRVGREDCDGVCGVAAAHAAL